MLNPLHRTVGCPSVDTILKFVEDIVLPPDDITVVEILKDSLDMPAIAIETNRQSNTVCAIKSIFVFLIFSPPVKN